MHFFYSYYPVFVITSHLLFLKAHFLVKPNASLLGKICSPAGWRITTWPCLGSPKKSIAGLAISAWKKLISGLDIWPGLDGPQPAQLIPAAMFSLLFRGEKLISGVNISAVLTPQKHKYCSSCLVPAVGPFLCNSLIYWLNIGWQWCGTVMSGNQEEAK